MTSATTTANNSHLNDLDLDLDLIDSTMRALGTALIEVGTRTLKYPASLLPQDAGHLQIVLTGLVSRGYEYREEICKRKGAVFVIHPARRPSGTRQIAA